MGGTYVPRSKIFPVGREGKARNGTLVALEHGDLFERLPVPFVEAHLAVLCQIYIR